MKYDPLSDAAPHKLANHPGPAGGTKLFLRPGPPPLSEGLDPPLHML